MDFYLGVKWTLESASQLYPKIVWILKRSCLSGCEVSMLGYDQFRPLFVVKSQYSSMNLISKNIKSKGPCDVYSQENIFSRDLIFNSLFHFH